MRSETLDGSDWEQIGTTPFRWKKNCRSDNISKMDSKTNYFVAPTSKRWVMIWLWYFLWSSVFCLPALYFLLSMHCIVNTIVSIAHTHAKKFDSWGIILFPVSVFPHWHKTEMYNKIHYLRIFRSREILSEWTNIAFIQYLDWSWFRCIHKCVMSSKKYGNKEIWIIIK